MRRAALERLLADEFRITWLDGMVLQKEPFMAATLAGRIRVHDAREEDAAINELTRQGLDGAERCHGLAQERLEHRNVQLEVQMDETPDGAWQMGETVSSEYWNCA